MDNEDLSRSIIIACVIGGILVLGINASLRYKIAKDEQFSELYVRTEESIPHAIRINNSHNISYYISNQKDYEAVYVYEIDSYISNSSQTIRVAPGDQVRFDLTLTAKDRQWDINLSLDSLSIHNLDVTRQAFISEQGLVSFVIDNKSLGQYKPFTFNLPHFGGIYHTNLSIEELRKQPFEIDVTNNITDGKMKLTSKQHVSFKSVNGSLILKTTILKRNSQLFDGHLS